MNDVEGWDWGNRSIISFEDSLANWKTIYTLHNRCPRKRNTEDIDEKRAGIWQNRIRGNYKKNTLSKERIDILNDVTGWMWRN